MKTKKEIIERLKELMKTQTEHIINARFDQASNLGAIIYGLSWCLNDEEIVGKLQNEAWKNYGDRKCPPGKKMVNG